MGRRRCLAVLLLGVAAHATTPPSPPSPHAATLRPKLPQQQIPLRVRGGAAPLVRLAEAGRALASGRRRQKAAQPAPLPTAQPVRLATNLLLWWVLNGA